MFFDLYIVTKMSIVENKHMTLAKIFEFMRSKNFKIVNAFVIDTTNIIVYVEDEIVQLKSEANI